MDSREKEGPFKVDHQISERIREELLRQSQPGASTLLRRLDHDIKTTDVERREIEKLARIALLSRPLTRDRIIWVLEKLGRRGYSLAEDYLKMSEERLKDYFFGDVQPDLGSRLCLYCNYDVVQDILTKKARMEPRVA